MCRRVRCSYLPPANEVCEGYVFTGVCHSVHKGGGMGRAWLLRGRHAWLLLGGHAWLLPGGHAWAPGGACMVALGGCAWLLGGHAWLLPGGHAWLLRGGVHGFFDEIRSMSGRYASYWNAFLFSKRFIEQLQICIFKASGCFVRLPRNAGFSVDYLRLLK